MRKVFTEDNRGSFTYYYLSLIVILTSVFLISTEASRRLYFHMQLESAYCAALLSCASIGTPREEDALRLQAEEAVYVNQPEAEAEEISVVLLPDGFALSMTLKKCGYRERFSAEYTDY